MTQISTGRKIGILARVAAGEAQRHAQSSRLVRGVLAGGRSFLASVSRAAHILWLQVTGLFFVVFALVGGIAFVKEYRAWGAGKIGPGRAVLALFFAVMFAWFGLSSFWRAGRKS